MAGICGLLEYQARPGAVALESRVLRMANRLRRRGPDAFALRVDARGGLALGHRQRAGEGGAQPLVSDGGRFLLTADLALRDAGSLAFGGDRCDALHLLEAICARGLDAVLPDLAGAFAFALWDRLRGVLTLARDAFGHRPLFYAYARCGGRLVFASEPAGLTAECGVPGDVDREGLATWLRDGYVAAPGTLIAGLRALPPGTRLVARASDPADPAPGRFATPADALASVEPFRGPGGGAALHRLLAPELERGGAILLHGGRGAVALAALARESAEKPVVSVSVGGETGPGGSLARARAVAERLGTDHRELVLGEEQVVEQVPRLARAAALPLADPVELELGLACELARRAAPRALHAIGADTLFGERVVHARVLRRRGLRARWRAEPEAIAARLVVLQARHAPGWTGVRGAAPRPPVLEIAEHLDPRRRVIAADLTTRIAQASLPALDRAAARAGVELGAPFLAPQVVRFAGALWAGAAEPDEARPLRALLARIAPRAALEPPPGAADLPLAGWLRGPLRAWAESLLAPERVEDEGIFEPGAVAGLWRDVCAGRDSGAELLWSVLAFRAWWESR